jgi:2-oxo-3-hexenedioate decarboxylase
MPNLPELAFKIDQAAQKARPISQLSLAHPFTEEEAYEIQALSLGQRYQRGEQFIGVKLGFTSKAKMEQMGVHDLIWGRLTNAMLLENGGVLSLNQHIHPRAEPEICFRVSQDLIWPLTLEEIKQFVDGVAAAIEVIDSRYENFKFSLEDVIADNCSSAAFVVGEWHDPGLALEDLGMELIIDGETVQSGSSAAILGNPWESVLAAARLGHQYGQAIPAGSYLMAGAATSAVYLKAGQAVSARVESLGEVEFLVH